MIARDIIQNTTPSGEDTICESISQFSGRMVMVNVQNEDPIEDVGYRHPCCRALHSGVLEMLY